MLDIFKAIILIWPFVVLGMYFFFNSRRKKSRSKSI